MARIRLVCGGYVYYLAEGEEAKLREGTEPWLLVEPNLDWLGAPATSQRVSTAQITTWFVEPQPGDSAAETSEPRKAS